MTWIIILIAIDLLLVIIGSVLWKKSNRLDPASERDKFKFFMQSQLGLVASVVAFLPLIIFILTNKNVDGKQKALLGGIAGVALVIAGISEEHTSELQSLMRISYAVLCMKTRKATNPIAT